MRYGGVSRLLSVDRPNDDASLGANMNRQILSVAWLIALSAILAPSADAQETVRPPRWTSSNLQRFECDGNREYLLSSAAFPTYLELDVDAKRIGVSATFSGTSLVDSNEPMVLTVGDGEHKVTSSSGFASEKGEPHAVFASVSAMLMSSGTHRVAIGVATDHPGLENQAVTVTMTCYR
jgi:hypothetical protein